MAKTLKKLNLNLFTESQNIDLKSNHINKKTTKNAQSPQKL